MKHSGPPFGSGPGGERILRVGGKRSRTPIYARPASQSEASGLAEPICATLIGSDRCSALGIAARRRAPTLALARALIEAGYDPNRPLNVYREGVLALAIRSIGEASRLTVEDDQHGRPRLRHWRNRHARCGAGSPVALSGQRVIQPSVRPKSMSEVVP